jgi:hypothetical protein
MRRTLFGFAFAGSALLVVGLSSASPAYAAKSGGTVPCSATALIAAVNSANASGGGTLNLSAGCTYTLTTPDNGENGLPVVTTRIGVNGNGATINGSDAVRIFEVDGPGGNLSLQNVTLTHGSASDFGGAILNSNGALTLNRSTVSESSAVTAGGGIASGVFGSSGTPSLTLNNSVVTGNSSPGTGNFDGVGGGIANNHGAVTLNSSWVNGNFAGGPQGGGIATGNLDGAPSPIATVTINNGQVNDNMAPNAGGGGIQNFSGVVTLNRTTVDANTSLNGGGIASGNGNGGTPPNPAFFELNQSEVNGNTATAAPGGAGPPIAAGGIANGGTMILNSTTVDDNTASHTSGGGIVNHGTMALNKSEVNGNHAAGTGGVASGGGIINASGPGVPTFLTINHSSVSENTAGGVGGGIANGLPNPRDPTMSLPGGTLRINHSEITNNIAGIAGGGIFNVMATVTLSHTSVTGNTPDNCEPTGSIAGCT